jgi:hypothetical protein
MKAVLLATLILALTALGAYGENFRRSCDPAGRNCRCFVLVYGNIIGMRYAWIEVPCDG